MKAIEQNRIKEICTLHGELVQLCRTSLEKAMRVGELLTEQKASLKHGEWGLWVTNNLPFTERTASNYTRLFRERARLKTETVSDLGQAYKLLMEPTPKSEEPKAGVCQQAKELAEQKLDLERDMGRAMMEMNETLTPLPGHKIVGIVEGNIVFHIECEGDEQKLTVYRRPQNKPMRQNTYTIKSEIVRGNRVWDLWWYLYKHVGIHKIYAIWNDEEKELTDRQTRLLREAWDDADNPNTFWDAASSIVRETTQRSDSDAFVRDALALHDRLMESHDRLCQKHALYTGYSQSA